MEVKNINNASFGDFNDSNPVKKRKAIPAAFSRQLPGRRWVMNQSVTLSARMGNMAASMKTNSTPRKITAPQMANDWMLPINPEYACSPESSSQVQKYKPQHHHPIKNTFHDDGRQGC